MVWYLQGKWKQLQIMYKFLFLAIFPLFSCSICLHAQEHDTLSLDKKEYLNNSMPVRHIFAPSFLAPLYPGMNYPMTFTAKPNDMIKKQQAARISALRSIDQSLYWSKPLKSSSPLFKALRIMNLFLSNPFNVPAGYITLHPSTPFLIIKVPGMAPYEYQYSSDKFPKFVETEYDFSTGTYKQVMVNRLEVEEKIKSGRSL